MFKKILIFVLCLATGLSALAGCSLVTDNNEKDSMQVIATVEAVNESGSDKHILNSAGYYEYNLSDNYFYKSENEKTQYTKNDVFYVKNGEIYTKDSRGYWDAYDVSIDDLVKRTESWSFKSEEKKIYKYQLYSYINSYAEQYMSSNNLTLKEATEYFVDQLVTREILLNEAEKLIAKGEIVLDNAYHNAVAKGVYSSIDNQYNTLLNNLLTLKGIELPETPDSTSTEPTYPLYPYDNTSDEGEEVLWNIEDEKYAAKWPGMVGSTESKSRELEAMFNLVKGLESTIKSDFRMTKDERKKAENDFVDIYNLIKTEGMQKVYPMLGDTFVIEYLIKKSVVEDQKITLLQNYIDKDVEATDEEILAEYQRTLKTQIDSYKEDISKYYTASGEKLVLYNPAPQKYIYVKHILVQFTEAQKAQLEAYKKIPGATTEGYDALRNRLANELVGYEHVNGEDDLTKPISIKTISNIIRSQMAAVRGDARQAERTFDKLIYKYNQDPGIFDSSLGYAVIHELGDDETETYVTEFAEGARKFRNETNEDGSNKYQIGDILDYNIVSDFGVHFMYYSYERPYGTVSINDYVTPGQYETYYDLLREAVIANKSNTAFEEWQNSTVYYYKDIINKVDIYTKRFKDVYKDA